MKYKIHSFRNAQVIFENDDSYKNDWFELLDVLDKITEEEVIDLFTASNREDIKSLSEPINKLIDERLCNKGWRRQCEIFNDSEYRESSGNRRNPWTLDFSKNEFAVEVAFNHGHVVAWNLIKLVLAGELNHVEKDVNTSVGVIVCATDELKKNGGFDTAVGSYEKFLQHLKPMNNILTVPIVVIGLCEFDEYEIRDRKAFKKRGLLPKNTSEKLECIYDILKNSNFDFEKKKEFDGEKCGGTLLFSKKQRILFYNSGIRRQKKLADWCLKNQWTTICVKEICTLDDLDNLLKEYSTD